MKDSHFPDLNATYLDSACTSLTPEPVIQRINEFYHDFPACPGRSSHQLSKKATEAIEQARETIATFIGAQSDRLHLTSGTTESINTIAATGDFRRVFISDREHNANRLPFRQRDHDLSILSTSNGIDLDTLQDQLTEDDLVSIVHISNIDGRELPLDAVSDIVHDTGASLLIDAAQSIPHRPFDISQHDPDFIAFSGHKMLGPTGTGALYVAERAEDLISPAQYGGGAVENVTAESIDTAPFPQQMEPGVPHTAGIIGFGAAVEFLQQTGMQTIHKHEKRLTDRLTDGLDDIGITYRSDGPGIVSLWFDGLTAHEAARMLDQDDILVRSGMHCAHPWFHANDLDPSIRASLYLYNDQNDIDTLLRKTRQLAML